MKHEEERTNQGLIGEGRNELTKLENIFFVQMMSK
jgi:hypothetical protein